MSYRRLEDQQIEQWLRVLRVLWLIFLGSTILYLPAAVVLSRSLGGGGGVSASLRSIVYAGGIGLLLASRVLPLPHPFSAGQDRSALVGKTQTVLLVRWVLTETTSILGLVLAALGGSWGDFLPLLLAGTLGLLLQAPARGPLRKRLGSETPGSPGAVD